jgi:hypothetical protein
MNTFTYLQEVGGGFNVTRVTLDDTPLRVGKYHPTRKADAL